MSDLIATINRYAGVWLGTSLDALWWERGRLALACSALLYDDRGDLLPAPCVDLPARDRALDVGNDLCLCQASIEIVAKQRASGIEYAVLAESTVRIEAAGRDGATIARPQTLRSTRPARVAGKRSTLVFDTSARVDPLTMCDGEPMPDGIWDICLRIRSGGWNTSARIGSRRRPEATRGATPSLVGAPPRIVIPYWTSPYDNLSLSVTTNANARPR